MTRTSFECVRLVGTHIASSTLVRMSVYAIRGEVDYTSQQRKIGGEYEHIGEVVREVGISNPYDARANHISLYPLYVDEASCLIVVDDGVGMDNTPLTKDHLRGCNGSALSTLASYFHIGHSTKPRGRDIGQFCMGSNLALVQADVLFVLVTRTAVMPQGQYWVVVQPRMHTTFADRSNELRSETMTLDAALTRVLDEVQNASDTMTSAWIEWIRASFDVLRRYDHGTLQMFVSRDTDLHRKKLLDVTQESWAAPSKRKVCRMITHPLHATQLWTYIRFMTRHGSMLAFHDKSCNLRTNQFPETYAKDTRAAELRIFTDTHPDGAVVPYGFPYIERFVCEDDEDVKEIRPGARIESLTMFYARLGPSEFTRPGSTGRTPVAVFVVMDCFKPKLEQYEGLDRTGHPRSGVGLSKMQGFVLSVHGVYITTIRGDAAERLLRALPTFDDDRNSTLTKLTKESLLAWNSKKNLNNIMILIDGIFDLKTDRNGITPTEMQRLTEPNFTLGLANAIQEMRVGRSIDARRFDEMLSFMDRTCKGDAERDIHDYCKRRAEDTIRAGSLRLEPRVDLVPCLRHVLEVGREAYALPGNGHEHSLVHLFGLYGAVIRGIHRIVDEQPSVAQDLDLSTFRRLVPYWERIGLIFNARGVDVQTFNWDARNDHVCLSDASTNATLQRMRQIEFKVELETPFNHPFLACDGIVVGSVRPDLVHVQDSQNYEAQIIRPSSREDPLYGVGFYLKDIKRGLHPLKSRVDRIQDHVIPVLVFLDLLEASVAAFATVEMTKTRPRLHDAKRPTRESVMKRKR